MARRISQFTAAGESEPRLRFDAQDDGRVTVAARGPDGQLVVVDVPWDKWFPMARQIFASRSRTFATVEFGAQT